MSHENSFIHNDLPYEPLEIEQPATVQDNLADARQLLAYRNQVARFENIYSGEPDGYAENKRYDNDPQAYVESVMQLVGGVATRGNIYALDIRPPKTRLHERSITYSLFLGWHVHHAELVEDLQKAHNISSDEYHTRVAPIFRNTLATMISGPRIIARNNFETARQEILQDVPKSPRARAELIKNRPISNESFAELEQAIGALPCVMPVPDFLRLSFGQQTKIAGYIGREYLDFLDVVYQRSGTSIFATELSGQPAIRGSIADLKQVIGSGIMASRPAIRRFLYDKQGFEALAQASKDMPVRETIKLPEIPAEESPVDAEQQQADEQAIIKTALLEQEIGDVVRLKADETRLTRAQVAEASASAFRNVGQHLYDLAGGEGEATLYQWTKSEEQIIDRLFKGFHGSDITRPRIVRLALNKSDQRVYEQSRHTMVAEPRRYALVVDVKSTGRAKMSLSIGMMMSARRYANTARIHCAVDAKSSGEVEQLVQESNLVAGVVSAHNVSNAMRGGLPGLGKQR